MKKLFVITVIVFLFGVIFSSCKSHERCPAYSKHAKCPAYSNVEKAKSENPS